jgi:hypothetical protein
MFQQVQERDQHTQRNVKLLLVRASKRHNKNDEQFPQKENQLVKPILGCKSRVQKTKAKHEFSVCLSICVKTNVQHDEKWTDGTVK